jgi:hypothetical protein
MIQKVIFEAKIMALISVWLGYALGGTYCFWFFSYNFESYSLISNKQSIIIN